MSEPIFELSRYARHRPWCPEDKGPADCTCGLYALLDSIRCVCGHKVSKHTNRDVSDVVGWPCIDCRSDRCPGCRPATPDASALRTALERLHFEHYVHQVGDPLPEGESCFVCAALASGDTE